MGLSADRNSSGLTSVASFAGRLWYAGASSEVLDGDERSPNIGTFVFFTQIIDSKNKYDKCYQEADPTSEITSDLIDSDGGFVSVSGANRIFKLVALQNSLVVFADNGIWQILGGEAGFSATGFQVGKVTDVAADSKKSIISAENVIFYWAKGGIYVLSPSDITPALRPENLTDQTIQTIYTSIPASGRKNATGLYDPLSKEVRWLFSDADDYDGINFRFKYNKELIYNTILSAFHINTLSNNVTDPDIPFGGPDKNEGICAYLETDSSVYEPFQVDVISNGLDVVVDCVDVTTSQLRAARRIDTSVKYLTLLEGTEKQEFNFSFYNDSTFKDWGRDDAKVLLVTGYESFGDAQRDKQVSHLIIHAKVTEKSFTYDDEGAAFFDNPSSIQVTFKWNWSETDNDTQDNGPIEMYTLSRQFIPDGIDASFDYPYLVTSTKEMPKGSGKVMSMKIESKELHDMHLLGWSTTVSGEARPTTNG